MQRDNEDEKGKNKIESKWKDMSSCNEGYGRNKKGEKGTGL